MLKYCLFPPLLNDPDNLVKIISAYLSEFCLNSALLYCSACLHCFDSSSFLKDTMHWIIKRILLFFYCGRGNFHCWGIFQEEVNLRFYRGRQSRESLWGLYESWRRLDMSPIWKGGVILWNYLFFRTQRQRGISQSLWMFLWDIGFRQSSTNCSTEVNFLCFAWMLNTV